MKKKKRAIWMAAGIFVYTWLFPQIAYRDCVRPVITEKQSRIGKEAKFTEEDYIRLFDPMEERFPIVWKSYLKEHFF